MRRQITSFSLMICGLCFIFGSIVSLISAPVASAMPSLAPSARPPVDRPPPERPTQRPEDSDDDDESSERSTAVTGRLTGTIIDATTQAPVPGMMVSVGGVTVVSDANGNYDTWLPVGSYTVGLMLSSEQGTDLQGPRAIDVRAGDTTVQHLFFRSTVASTTAEQPLPTPTVAAPASPVDVLPNTGVVSTKPQTSLVRPQRLPVTSIPNSSPLLWLSLGMALMLVGMIVGVTTKGSRVDHKAASRVFEDNELLASLLAVQPRYTSRFDETLLARLLNEECEG